jgi:hypothetical protein
MKIHPSSSIKNLAECIPGQVVRDIAYGKDGKFGLVSDIADCTNRAIVYLSDHSAEYALITNPETYKVLAYLGETVWEIDQLGPFEPPMNSLFNKAGCLIRSSESWLLNVKYAFGSSGIHRVQYDLNLGKLFNYREFMSDVAVFGAWALYLLEEGEPSEHRIELARFNSSEPIK